MPLGLAFPDSGLWFSWLQDAGEARALRYVELGYSSIDYCSLFASASLFLSGMGLPSENTH